MDLVILNESLEIIGNIDQFESLIWSERYFECGDFELLTYPSQKHISLGVQGYYISIKESDRLMLIEDVNIKTDPVEGNKLVIKGRSIEILLDRRIIWEPVIFENTNFQECVLALLNNNVLNPTDPSRKMDIFEFEASTDPIILSNVVSTQLWGVSLYKAIVDLCFANRIGWKVTWTDENKFRFKLYTGVDRSYEQTENPYVVFSPNFENLKNSTYVSTDKIFKTVALTMGDKGVGNAPIFIEVLINDSTGIYRREVVIDAQDVSRVDSEGNPIPDEVYIEHLIQRAREELTKLGIIRSLSSELDPIGSFVYGEDFFLGDILQVSNEYGIENRSRVIEIIRSQDTSGIKVLPIFNVAPSRFIAEEFVNLKKYLDMDVDPKGDLSLGKGLDIYIDEEVAGKFYEAVGLDKKLNILVQVYESVILDKFCSVLCDEEITQIGYHEIVYLDKYLDLDPHEDEISATAHLSKGLGLEITEQVT